MEREVEDTEHVAPPGKGVTMEADTNEAIELCRRVLTSPVHCRNPHWGEDFIAHRIAEHPEIRPEVARIRRESEPQLPHV
ncbi:MAG TPA: hypothetical protein VGG39_08485 [Polyangiaceae bacterium]|jgi:hypothetical protein